ncbi:MAG: S41 family peptidase [Chloroflexota bacterium]
MLPQRAIPVLLVCSCLVIGCSSAPLATNLPSPTTLPTKLPTDIPQPTPTVTTTNHPELWQTDLQLLESMLPRRHTNTFFTVSEAEFREDIQQLRDSVHTKQDHEIIVGIMQIVARIGDGHTFVERPVHFRTYPFDIYWFNDGLHVIHTDKEHQQLQQSRLVQIGNTPIEEAYERVRTVISHENEMWLKAQSTTALTTPEILHALDIVPDLERANFTFEDTAGQRFTVQLEPAIALREESTTASEESLPLYRQIRNDFYWYTYQEDTQTLYLQYNWCRDDPAQPFEQFAEEVLAFVDTHPIEHFVIDLRHNTGGNSYIIDPLIEGITERPAINQKDTLFVIIGRQTFSSGMLNALDFKTQTNALLIGEPTGGKPNAYGEVRHFSLLSQDNLHVNYSTKYFEMMDDDPPSVIPDITVEISSEDYFADRDPVMEAILACEE